MSSCAAPGLFTDGSSVSLGAFNEGALRRGAHLPEKGEGFLVPPLWAVRDSRWGTDELIGGLTRAARRVAREYPGGVLGIGDLSLAGGGPNVLHRSHHNGRDADLIFYATDERGKPVPPVDSMPRYPTLDGRAYEPRPQEHGVVFGPFSPRWFDVRRNWALVRALLTDPHMEIQYLFIHQRLRDRLLAWAAEQCEDPALIERAAELLRRPGDSAPHDDHLHVRIYCAADDRALGCNDRGPQRWWKKRYKYMAPTPRATAEEVADAVAPVVGSCAWKLARIIP
jgi:penicillin-insensitive murein endopeptidase